MIGVGTEDSIHGCQGARKLQGIVYVLFSIYLFLLYIIVTLICAGLTFCYTSFQGSPHLHEEEGEVRDM